MAAPKKTASLASAMAEANAKADNQSETLYKQVTTEDKVPVSLAPQYRAYFGNIMTVCVSGLTIYFPVDGRVYNIPKTFAAEIYRRERAVNSNIMKRERAAKVEENSERYAGELKII